jgi:hypothetical protein
MQYAIFNDILLASLAPQRPKVDGSSLIGYDASAIPLCNTDHGLSVSVHRLDEPGIVK